MVTELFSESFLKQIFDWCEIHNLKLTGHMVMEETLGWQVTINGACMPHYEYMHIPGMDWLGRNIRECLTPKQVSSVAEQLGRKQVLSETFAMCGHNVSLAELKGIYEWQMVHGINLLCQHLEGYSIRGMRKRDYPPAMYYQQPWWCEYEKFNTAMARVGMILSEGKVKADILLIHPITTAWTMFNDRGNYGMEELNNAFMKTVGKLEEKHIIYHFGDEIIMERHAYVKDGKLVIGEQEYTTVITSCCTELLDNTKKLLDEFAAQGGKISKADDIAENYVTNNSEITYTKRACDGYNAHYFVNTSNERKTAKINVCGKMLDIYNGDLLDFSGNHEFEPWGSLMIIEDGSENVDSKNKIGNIVKLSDEFEITKPIQNMITLDRCDYYFDGNLIEKDGYVLNICERANELERPVHIHQDYHINAEYVPDKIELVCETPEIFEIAVNGEKVNKEATGWVIDKSFKKIDISKHLKIGQNTISFDCDFKQSGEVYGCIKKAKVFETEKNKLVYDMEIEAVYLLGDFTVKTDGVWEELDNDASRYYGEFTIAEPKRKIKPKHIEQQGYPFFCGKLEFEGNIEFTENDVLEIDMKGIGTVTVEIGDVKKTLLTDNRIKLSDFRVSGKQRIRLTVTNNLRNLLGPHHLAEGECKGVSPAYFYKDTCVWNLSEKQEWSEGYCFCEMSI